MKPRSPLLSSQPNYEAAGTKPHAGRWFGWNINGDAGRFWRGQPKGRPVWEQEIPFPPGPPATASSVTAPLSPGVPSISFGVLGQCSCPSPSGPLCSHVARRRHHQHGQPRGSIRGDHPWESSA